jgi:hypothetical protein
LKLPQFLKNFHIFLKPNIPRIDTAMTDEKDLIEIHVNVKITTVSLQTIVGNAKKVAGRNEKGYYQVDTADKVSEMISSFLLENDFEGYVEDINNY